jgi:group I intron endonuclease
MHIYKITNKINGKVYIGKTIKPLHIRWSQHISKSKRNTKHKFLLHNAICKYGPINFDVELIYTAKSIEDLADREKQYIKQYNTFNNPSVGYNMTDGGDGGTLSDIAKKRLRIIMSTPEYREKIRISSTGRIFSPESIEKRAVKLRGQHRSPEHKERMRQAALGRTNTTEHNAKISNSLMGRGKGIYFKVYNGNTYIGSFDNIRKFCVDHPIMSDVSLKHLLYGKKLSCKGYTAQYITKEEFDSIPA